MAHYSIHHKISSCKSRISSQSLQELKKHLAHYTIIDPNGVNDKRASLKYCFPKGIPIIVIQYKHPKAVAVSAKGKPVTHIQSKRQS